SLINKMLQDLDARGTPGAPGFPSHVKPVAAPERRAPALRLAGLCAGAALVVAALGWFTWDRMHAVPAARPAAVLKPAAGQKAAPVMSATITQLPVTKPALEVAPDAAPEAAV